MLTETTSFVRARMQGGKSLDEIKKEGVPEKWKAWSWQFISADSWIETIHKSLTVAGGSREARRRRGGGAAGGADDRLRWSAGRGSGPGAAAPVAAGPEAVPDAPPVAYASDEAVEGRRALRFADGQVSLNDQCPVRKRGLNLRLLPVYVNGAPIGFC